MKTKTTLIALLCLFFSVQSLQSQVYKYIPDPNFRNYLRDSLNCVFHPSGDSLDIADSSVIALRYMWLQDTTVSDIRGVEYFTNLYTLYITNSKIRHIYAMPSSLIDLECFNNIHLSMIDSFPENLTKLLLSNDSFTTIPTIPNSIYELDCPFNYLTSIPNIPTGAYHVNLINNQLSSIPILPSNVINLSLGKNQFTSIPVLTNYLLELSIDSNYISNIDSLPSTLQYLTCSNNQITTISNLPDSLKILYCESNNLTNVNYLPANIEMISFRYNAISSLPNLPDHLYELSLNNNPYLTCLPYLPNSLSMIDFDSTAVTCIPNYVPGLFYYPYLGTFPFCNPSVHSCPSYNSIEGNTFKDVNNNCVIDSLENKLQNIPIVLKNGLSTIYRISSATNGSFAFDTITNGNYTIHIDTFELPFTITCPSSGFDTINKDSSHIYFTNQNFALQCKPDFDLAISGIHTTSLIRPASSIYFNFHAGDVSKQYGTSCIHIPATIIINYSGHLNYTGIFSGSLVPDTILPNRLVWNIADVSTLNFYSDIAPMFNIDSTAVIGDLLCFNTSISPSSADRIPSNNSYSQCFTVVAAYDPNFKEANPSGTITSSQDWMNYTIHFQNMGTSYAENIYIWDTIDTNLDLNTIHIIGASHNQFMKVFQSNRAVLFNFLGIHLPDSTTDESASHGWVQYRIKPIAGLTEGMHINNSAGILFDLNTPVYTNTTTNRICNTPSIVSQTYTITEGQSISIGSHSYNQSGTYTDILSNVNGCDSTINTTIRIVAGLEESAPIRLIMYPNPASNLVHIEIEGIPNMYLSIVDMYGRKVYENTSISNRYNINTESLMNGTYIIQYGKYHQKLVINH